MSVVPQGKSVQALYRDYREGNLLVNRSYQRKLVWSVDEKRQLIDSILKGYPIPLILLAERPDVHGSGRFEIVDGIQRFNAIFTFIENYFDYEGKYFDVTEFARAKQAADDGVFLPVYAMPLLSPVECANLLDYQLAVTIYPTADESQITEVFGRVNSGGRQLSPQEQRQAGVSSEFARLIRTLSSEIRGDVSRDVLLLSDMPEISVDSAREPHGYGVKAEQIFWCRQGILSVKQLRESEDEQMLADIAASILSSEPLPASKELLDKLYDPAAEEGKDIDARLATYGSRRLMDDIKRTFSVLRQTIAQCDDSPNYLRSKVRPGTSYPIKAPFYAIFMAFFDLVVTQQKTPEPNASIVNALDGLDSRLSKGAHYETTDNRSRNIKITKGLIQEQFIAMTEGALGHGPALLLDFENALRRSRIETPRYEFKQGILRLDNDRGIDSDLLARLTETACGIANLGPHADGYIFIGVADRGEHATRIETLDGAVPRQIAGHYVVGVDREARVLDWSLDSYVRFIVDAFQKAEITDPLRTQILASFDAVTVHDLSVIRIRVPQQTDVSFVSGKAYYREGSSTIEIEGPRLVAVSKLFK
ncbi:MAG: DUF262 domain-containing protein [candidate division NC10 bacterium]|nr:DUF262 domain-containing protein [candidate division NC10 bacterium]